MIVEKSNNGIKYEWGLEGPGGMTVMLYPVKGQFSQTDIVEAKTQLRKDLNVVYIQVYWITKEEDEVLIPVVNKISTEDICEIIEE